MGDENGVTTLSGAIEDLAGRGFGEHFAVLDDALTESRTGQSFAPRDVIIRDYFRFEGISDPDDMSIVYAVETRNVVSGESLSRSHRRPMDRK